MSHAHDPRDFDFRTDGVFSFRGDGVMPKLKHFAIATLVVGGLCALVGGLIWLGSLYPKVFGALVLLAFAAALIFVFASTYTANEEIMKGNDDG